MHRIQPDQGKGEEAFKFPFVLPPPAPVIRAMLGVDNICGLPFSRRLELVVQPGSKQLPTGSSVLTRAFHADVAAIRFYFFPRVKKKP